MTRVGVVFGGTSEEHDVSVKSAREVARSLGEQYDVCWIRIGRDGDWRLVAGPDDPAGKPAVISPDRTAHGLLVDDQVVHLDVVLPVLHGRHGEDGAIQGLLELSGIPYAGCGIAASALCMDKELTYAVVRSAGIATPEFRLASGEETDLHLPVFVKPARSGSSFGVSRVDRPEDLAGAIREARRYDNKVLIEQAVVGSEVGCAVLGERFGLITGEVDRVALMHGFFRIHQEATPETGSENSAFVCPADIPDDARRLVQQTAKTVYLALGCQGLARVDLFLAADGSVVLNEVNTMPGLTSYSRYPRMMAAAGLPLGEVLDRLIAMTLHGGKR